MPTVLEVYQAEIQRLGYQADPGQQSGLQALARCEAEWRHYKSRRGGRMARVFVHPPLPKGVYLWGGVGRGKSFLMDCFFQAVPLERKVRLHFHEFMRATHRELHELRGLENPLDEVALRVARRYRLICFDEFHISDIADAMILERLLRALLSARVGFVMTSNYPPLSLYPDGLHRDRLLPALELLERSLEVVSLDHSTDFRRIADQIQLDDGPLPALTPVYRLVSAPEDSIEVELEFARMFEALADGPEQQPGVLRIESREVRARRLAGGVVWFDFETLCGGPRSQNDYLELAQRFHTVLLTGVPRLSVGQASEARRLTWLVDILYDHGVRLDLSAECLPDALYTEGVLAGEFRRTASRLTEMRTAAYLRRRPRSFGSPQAGSPVP